MSSEAQSGIDCEEEKENAPFLPCQAAVCLRTTCAGEREKEWEERGKERKNEERTSKREREWERGKKERKKEETKVACFLFFSFPCRLRRRRHHWKAVELKRCVADATVNSLSFLLSLHFSLFLLSFFPLFSPFSLFLSLVLSFSFFLSLFLTRETRQTTTCVHSLEIGEYVC